MIVPMKKVSLIVRSSEKKNALKKLRKLGLLHMEIKEGSGLRLLELQEQIAGLETAVYTVTGYADKNTASQEASAEEAVRIAQQVASLMETQKTCHAQAAAHRSELDRLKDWGDVDPAELKALAEKGLEITLCELAPSEYEKLGEENKTIVLGRTKNVVRFAVIRKDAAEGGSKGSAGETQSVEMLKRCQIKLPEVSTVELKKAAEEAENRLRAIEEELRSYAAYAKSMKNAVKALQKEIEFETYATGMAEETLSEEQENGVRVAYFVGYLPAADLDQLKAAAKENAWGLIAEDPTEEDDVPTKLQNNKFVSLIYPMTDFMGSVPGYFEYDISGWFLGFILIFFGIIFGDGGYGLLICGAAAALIAKNVKDKKEIQPAFLLMALLGGATVLWGLVTCTWFGMDTDMLPGWLCKLSIPVISNVYADKIWYPFWTNGEAGLTTAQNVQIFCFTIALIQLSVAHVKGAARNKGSLKMLGDIGTILQLVGIYYVVLSLVVNGAVFGLGLVINGIPVGTIAIALVGLGFVTSFVFANYEGNILQSTLASLKDIVSVLLGVVNVFSDIVSYIRLWAVGLAGAAISATVNELAGPMFGKLVFVIFAVFILVFGHGLNMILNVLSVIVHGIRLNTLEFSSHLDMSWSGHKYKPFEE